MVPAIIRAFFMVVIQSLVLVSGCRMCDLFGMSSDRPRLASESLRSLRDTSVDNPDGWGIAYYQDGKAHLWKKPEVAVSSRDFEEILSTASSTLFIAHVRMATRGDVCTENCHPFVRTSFGRDWVFAHNGTIERAVPHSLSQGTTDSEQVFHTLIDTIGEYMRESEYHGLYPGIKKGIKNLFAQYGRAINFNFLLSDGTILYAFRHHAEKPLFISFRENGPGASVVISTRRLGPVDPREWRPLPRNKVILVTGGRLLVVSDAL